MRLFDSFSSLRSRALCVGLVTLLGLAAGRPASPLVAAPRASARPAFKAVAFDYFVLFNPDSVVDEIEPLFPGKGRDFVNLWRTRQFEYTWLRALTHRYVDFSSVTEDALLYAANSLHLAITPADKHRLLQAYFHLRPWPDSASALRRLRSAGIRIITLANFTPAMLRSNADNAGLTGSFDELVSTDENQSYKPEPRAYQLGLQHLHLPKQQIVFAAFGGWDAAGAKSFGYPTVWINRFQQPTEELGIRPDRTTADLEGLLDIVLPPEAP